MLRLHSSIKEPPPLTTLALLLGSGRRRSWFPWLIRQEFAVAAQGSTSPNNVIEVRGKSTTVRGIKIKGKKLKFGHTEKSRAMEANVKSLNKFLTGVELEGGSFSGYRRLFSNGDIDGFNFQWGGRLYGVGDYSY